MTGARLPGWLRLIGRIYLAVAGLLLLIWIMAGAGYFWPAWPWAALALAFAVGYVVVRSPAWLPGQRGLAIHGGISCALAAFLMALWMFAGFGYFWPMWPWLGLGLAVGIHVAIANAVRSGRENELTERVNVLTRTRSGALDSQAAELRRIERDLHDGAQARMVSLGINLGLAEDLLERDPGAAADLLAEARTTNLAALDDLRSLVRGIHPPVLADRGLIGAVEALALDLAVPVTVTAELPGRPPAPVESAAYFAVAECLANVAKHSRATAASVVMHYGERRLSIVVVDDGVGGARLDGGSGLSGVARRLAAFDGTIHVDSPVNGPTIVTLEVPCALSSPKTLPSSGTA
ncbi:MAG TPA: histidine kinase [Acidimicrobiales bacterium]|nr:histidine kinase [Acidimicrobiales bacterium]